MNFGLFALYFLICYSILFIIKKLYFLLVLKKKANTISKDVEKTLEQFFGNYDSLE